MSSQRGPTPTGNPMTPSTGARPQTLGGQAMGMGGQAMGGQAMGGQAMSASGPSQAAGPSQPGAPTPGEVADLTTVYRREKKVERGAAPTKGRGLMILGIIVFALVGFAIAALVLRYVRPV